ncbi:MAG: hypothetical protein QM571_02855 [Micrococcaceae bacterium]
MSDKNFDKEPEKIENHIPTMEELDFDSATREYSPDYKDEPLIDEIGDAFEELGREVIQTVKDIPESFREFGQEVKRLVDARFGNDNKEKDE